MFLKRLYNPRSTSYKNLFASTYRCESSSRGPYALHDSGKYFMVEISYIEEFYFDQIH